MGLYRRTTKGRNKEGSTVEDDALAENIPYLEKGYVEAKAVLERLIHRIRRVLDDTAAAAFFDVPPRIGGIDIADRFDLGVVHVAKALWGKLGINEAMR